MGLVKNRQTSDNIFEKFLDNFIYLLLLQSEEKCFHLIWKCLKVAEYEVSQPSSSSWLAPGCRVFSFQQEIF